MGSCQRAAVTGVPRFERARETVARCWNSSQFKETMRRMNISKEAQIRGLKKALANRKTPRGFLPGMKKRLAKLMQ